MKKLTMALILLLASILVPVWPASATLIQIDLKDFYADPSVSVVADGSSATMNENADYTTVLLSNDPYFGDPGIEVPADLLTLNFSYSFSVGNGNNDEFYAWVFDGDDGTILRDLTIRSYGASTVAGTVSWDLSGINPLITLLGLEFQLNSLETDPSEELPADSYVRISNVYMETASVPEPATILLLASGLFGILGVRRRKLRN